MLLYSCGSHQNVPHTDQRPNCPITPELKELIGFDVVKEAMAASEIELTGNVSYNMDERYRYQSLASGWVQKVYFNLGDYVQKGQLLAELRTTELSEQRSSLSVARASLKLAQRNLDAVSKMHKDGLASDKELLEAQNEVNASQAEIEKIVESAALQGGSIEKGILAIRAPMSGYIVEKKLTNGYQVNAGDDDLFVISDLRKVWVMANVYAAQLGKVATGAKVEITTTAYPDKVFEGRIARMSNVFDPEEKVLKAIIEIANADLKLKPDMMVSVTVQRAADKEGLALPIASVIFDDDEYHVLVYHNDCDVRSVKVKPFAQGKHAYYIDKDNGLIGAGDSLIVKNQLLIFNKLKGQ